MQRLDVRMVIEYDDSCRTSSTANIPHIPIPPAMSQTEQLLAKAREIGFDPVGVCRAVPAATFPAYADWLDRKMYGDSATDNDANRGMTYLARHRDARRHPDSLLPGVQAIVVVGLSYEAVHPDATADVDLTPQTDVFGLVAGYARGVDYHDVMRGKLRQLAESHRLLFPDAKSRIAVDTAPILEREYAQRAGLGWPGKNTMLINERCGSRFFLGLLLSTVELGETDVTPFFSGQNDLPLDSPERYSFCGSCRRCVDACPTGALATPYRLDARKCLNYWSIEDKGNEIPPEIADRFDNRLYGCETCQNVCPFNEISRDASPQTGRSCLTCQPHEKFRPKAEKTPLTNVGVDPASLSLREQLEIGIVSISQIENLDEAGFQRQFAGTPLIRLGLARLKRNAAVVRRNA